MPGIGMKVLPRAREAGGSACVPPRDAEASTRTLSRSEGRAGGGPSLARQTQQRALGHESVDPRQGTRDELRVAGFGRSSGLLRIGDRTPLLEFLGCGRQPAL